MQIINFSYLYFCNIFHVHLKLYVNKRACVTFGFDFELPFCYIITALQLCIGNCFLSVSYFLSY